MVCILIFDGMTVKTENKMILLFVNEPIIHNVTSQFLAFCLPVQVAQNMSSITFFQRQY